MKLEFTCVVMMMSLLIRPSSSSFIRQAGSSQRFSTATTLSHDAWAHCIYRKSVNARKCRSMLRHRGAAAASSSSSPPPAIASLQSENSAYAKELSVAREIVYRVSSFARQLQQCSNSENYVSQKKDPSAIVSSTTKAQDICKEKETQGQMSVGNEEESEDAGANPVTVADFTVQALVLSALHKAFPTDRFIAEESSEQLLRAGRATVHAVVDNCCRFAMSMGVESSTTMTRGQQQQQQDDDDDVVAEGGKPGWGGWPGTDEITAEEVCRVLDLGRTGLDDDWSKRGGRTWVLDPIDGTKGFMKGDQFAVALALMDLRVPVIGILGCPTLASDIAACPTANEAALAGRDGMPQQPSSSSGEEKGSRPAHFGGGCLFWAERSEGAFMVDLGLDDDDDEGGGAGSGGDRDDVTTHLKELFDLERRPVRQIRVSNPCFSSSGGNSNPSNGSHQERKPSSFTGGGLESVDFSRAVRCESAEAAHSSHGEAAAAAALLGMGQSVYFSSSEKGTYKELPHAAGGAEFEEDREKKQTDPQCGGVGVASDALVSSRGRDDGGALPDLLPPPPVVRMDGMGKYGVIARGDAHVLMRLPRPGYVENIWDVLPGLVILEEAGGKVTDLAGDSIECAANGAKLSESVTGIVVSCGEPLHGAVVQALQRVRQ